MQAFPIYGVYGVSRTFCTIRGLSHKEFHYDRSCASYNLLNLYLQIQFPTNIPFIFADPSFRFHLLQGTFLSLSTSAHLLVRVPIVVYGTSTVLGTIFIYIKYHISILALII